MSASAALGSVIIPAHNEEPVISRCLADLVAGFQPGELEVVVVCNGCSDGTAEAARSSTYPVRVLEVEIPSKTAAIRAGEGAVSSFPRLYLDADVVVTGATVRQVLEHLRAEAGLVARPPIKYDTSRSSTLVRSYYRARRRVPAVMNSVWGAGVYGLSEKARSRFHEYPDVVADDLFVDRHFEPSEIEILKCTPVIVKVPRRLGDLLRILRRTYHGIAEPQPLARNETCGTATTSSTIRDLVRLAVSRPYRALDVCVYIGMAALARLTLRISPPTAWARDDGSREV